MPLPCLSSQKAWIQAASLDLKVGRVSQILWTPPLWEKYWGFTHLFNSTLWIWGNLWKTSRSSQLSAAPSLSILKPLFSCSSNSRSTKLIMYEAQFGHVRTNRDKLDIALSSKIMQGKAKPLDSNPWGLYNQAPSVSKTILLRPTHHSLQGQGVLQGCLNRCDRSHQPPIRHQLALR